MGPEQFIFYTAIHRNMAQNFNIFLNLSNYLIRMKWKLFSGKLRLLIVFLGDVVWPMVAHCSDWLMVKVEGVHSDGRWLSYLLSKISSTELQCPGAPGAINPALSSAWTRRQGCVRYGGGTHSAAASSKVLLLSTELETMGSDKLCSGN